jgi:predicted TPR repeat methyltransferase
MNKSPKTTASRKGRQSELNQEQVAYNKFAPYYDKYMQHVDYDRWTEKLLSLYKQHGIHPLEDILELACGTASISERLVRKGYKVTASDRSEGMLRYAAQKAYKPVLYQSDMTDALPEKTYDLILIVFDSINYLTEQTELEKLFRTVSPALKSGGLFMFDVSTYRNSTENFNGYLNLDEDKDYVLIHRADFDAVNRIQKTHLTIFERSDNHYIRSDEEHIQKVWYVSEMLSVCERSPLECIGIYSLVYDKNLLRQNPRKLDHQYSRLFFVLRNR